MVYAAALGGPIPETHPVRPASPYAASKLAGEQLTIAYGLAYDHPVTVARPFNTYGPFQRSDGEGGVVAIFCGRALDAEPIDVFGDGGQTRDLLYVEDCAEFVVRAATSSRFSPRTTVRVSARALSTHAARSPASSGRM